MLTESEFTSNPVQLALTSDDTSAIKNLKQYVLRRHTRANILNMTEFIRKRKEVDNFLFSHDEEPNDVNVHDILNLLSRTLFLYNPTRAGRFINFVILMNDTETNSQSSTPLTEEKVDQIEKCEFKDLTQEAIGHELSTKCPICQEQYAHDDEVSILPCNGKHYYHTDCIKGWFKVSDICPICRESMTNKI